MGKTKNKKQKTKKQKNNKLLSGLLLNLFHRCRSISLRDTFFFGLLPADSLAYCPPDRLRLLGLHLGHGLRLGLHIGLSGCRTASSLAYLHLLFHALGLLLDSLHHHLLCLPFGDLCPLLDLLLNGFCNSLRGGLGSNLHALDSTLLRKSLRARALRLRHRLRLRRHVKLSRLLEPHSLCHRRMYRRLQVRDAVASDRFWQSLDLQGIVAKANHLLLCCGEACQGNYDERGNHPSARHFSCPM